MTDDKFAVSVVLAIFIKGENDSVHPQKCAFYDKEGKISLPSQRISSSQHASQVAVSLLKSLVPIDLKLLHITPVGFFDPITEKESPDREILLGYRVIISPGMPIHKELEFKDHADLGISAARVTQNHFRVFRAALHSG